MNGTNNVFAVSRVVSCVYAFIVPFSHPVKKKNPFLIILNDSSLRITVPGVEDAKEDSNTVAVLRTHTTYNRLVLLCLRKPWVTKPLNWRMAHICRIDTPDSSDVLVSFALPWYSGGHSVPYTWVFCLCNSN